MNRCFLHIGTEKTGSTSLQFSLQAASEALRKHGASYVSYKTHNSRPFVAAMSDIAKPDSVHHRKGLKTEGQRLDYRAKVVSEVKEKIVSQINSGRKDIIISSEHFHSRLSNASEVERVRSMLMDIFDKIYIVIYLRPQIDLAVSRYTTRLLSGYTGEKVLHHSFTPENHYFNYLLLYNLWSRIFGQEYVIVRDYTKVSDIVSDFSAVIGLSNVPSSRVNEAISISQMKFLISLNKATKELGSERAKKVREKIVSRMERGSEEKKNLVSHADALSFQRRFDESNERLEESVGRPLFEINFSKYCNEAELLDPSAKDVFDNFYKIFDRLILAKKIV